MDEKQTKIEQVKGFIENLKSKEFTLYFFTLDTKGNPTAGIANIYEHVKILNSLGYKAVILHEKKDYKLRGDEAGMGIADWLGEEYARLPHSPIEDQNLNIAPTDFIIIPEVFSTIMEQVKSFPCRKIVFCQSYDYLLELLPIGKRWDLDYGFNHVITTSDKQAAYVRQLFQQTRIQVVPVSIPSFFKPNILPKIPVVSILTRNPGDAAKIAKSFYLQYPVYRWITFKEMRGLSREQFAEDLAKSCLAVWIDDSAGFGTFPLEAFEVGTPVIGKIPNMIPEWMEAKDENGNSVIKNNGVWTNTTVNIPELIATFLKVWFEDAVPTELYETMKSSAGKYGVENQTNEIKRVYGELINERIAELEHLVKTEEAVA